MFKKEFIDKEVLSNIDWSDVDPENNISYSDRLKIGLLIDLNIGIQKLFAAVDHPGEVIGELRCPKCREDVSPNELGYCPNCKTDLAKIYPDKIHIGKEVDGG